MQHYPDNYVLTGNNVPVQVEQFINYVHQELDRYDNLVKMTGNVPQYSPYTNPIIFTTEDGRQVQIPENIQQEAIRVWVESKSAPIQHTVPQHTVPHDEYTAAKRQYEDLQESPYSNKNGEEMEPVDQEIEQNIEDDVPQYENTKPITQPIVVVQKDNTFMYLALALICIIILYYFYKNNKTQQPPWNY